MVGVFTAWLGFKDKCELPVADPPKFRRGGLYTDTRNREILDKLIREKVDDVEVLGAKSMISVHS